MLESRELLFMDVTFEMFVLWKKEFGSLFVDLENNY